MNIPRFLLPIALSSCLFSSPAKAATEIWDGSTTGDLDTATNWNGGLPATGDTAEFNGVTSGALSLTFDSETTGTGTNAGWYLYETGSQTGSLGINASTAAIKLRLYGITLDSGAGALSIGTSGSAFTLVDLGVAGPGTGGSGATSSWINNSSNLATIGSKISILNSNQGTLTFGGSGNWLVSAEITQNTTIVPSLLKSGTGTLTMSANNGSTGAGGSTVAFTGNVTINGGILNVANANALGDDTNSTIAQPNQQIIFTGGQLQYGAGITTDYASRIKSSTSSVSIDTNGNNVSYATGIDSSNTAGLTLNDSAATKGSLTLAGANTYTGATLVKSGTLNVTGSLAAGTATTVTGALLEGTGTLNGTVGIGNGSGAASSALIAPGTIGTIGTLTTGAMTMGSDGAFKFDLNSTTDMSDLLDVIGNFTLASGAELLATDLGSSLLAANTQFVLADYSGTLSGTFANVTNGMILIGQNEYTINYGTGTNSEITLDVAPEPQTWTLMLGGLGLLLAIRRVRRLANS